MRQIAGILGTVLAVVVAVGGDARASTVEWESAATGGRIAGKVMKPSDLVNKPVPTVVYLKNLSTTRVGQEADETILDDLTRSGHLVLVLDYARHAKAVSPTLNSDVLKLRQDIADPKKKSLLVDLPVDVNRLFIVPEGCRLKRDVEFDRDGQRVLGMDVIYPSKPKAPVPMVLEVTCDNKDRMGAGSLLYCRDTLMEGAAIAGFASAMIDHPVPPPYKGLDDPMPQVIHRLKSAVRTARAMSDELGTNGKIGVIGFSRGGPMAGLLAATGDRKDLEGDGPHQGVSSRIQAAVVHGNRYDYLDLRDDDPMLARFEKAWGPRQTSAARWAAHGVAAYLTKDAAPMFLNTSDTESPEYRDGLDKLSRKLGALGVPHEYRVDADGRGHRVATDAATLEAIYSFIDKHLRADPPSSR